MFNNRFWLFKKAKWRECRYHYDLIKFSFYLFEWGIFNIKLLKHSNPSERWELHQQIVSHCPRFIIPSGSRNDHSAWRWYWSKVSVFLLFLTEWTDVSAFTILSFEYIVFIMTILFSWSYGLRRWDVQQRICASRLGYLSSDCKGSVCEQGRLSMF